MKVKKFDWEIGYYEVEELPVKLTFTLKPTKIGDLKFYGN